MWRWQGAFSDPEKGGGMMEPLWSWDNKPKPRQKDEKTGKMKDISENEQSNKESELLAKTDYVPFNR